jgi:hypothetical protein
LRDHGAGELDAGEEVSGEFVVAGGDGAKVLEFVEEALDEIALAVEREVTRARRLAIGFRSNHRCDVAPGQGVDERVGVESFIANQHFWIGRIQQGLGASEIVGLPGRQHDFDGISERIDQGVDFGGQSTARSPDRLFAVFFVRRHCAGARAR